MSFVPFEAAVGELDALAILAGAIARQVASPTARAQSRLSASAVGGSSADAAFAALVAAAFMRWKDR